MSCSSAPGRTSRRALYRDAKRILYKSAVRRWTGSRAALERRIRAFLRGRARGYLFRLVRRPAFALVVASALLVGTQAQASSPIELSAIALDANAGGFVINGRISGSRTGRSVSGAGDVNGDGLADIIVGAPYDTFGPLRSGISYVLFGKDDGNPVDADHIINEFEEGFGIGGISLDDHSGYSVSGAGDVNGDGLADLIVGAPGDSASGESYIVFGKAYEDTVFLTDIVSGIGGFGFVIDDIGGGGGYNRSVSAAGDVNGDGLADLIVGAPSADPGGDNNAGTSYVVFGKATTTAVELSDIAADANAGGFIINGIDSDDFSGWSVSGAGDVNGDGLADLIIGAFGADPGAISYAGESYVVFGKADGTKVELSDIAMDSDPGGFIINGSVYSGSGRSVSGAGDVNGDGLADLIVGGPLADPGVGVLAGESYVVFGKANGSAVELSDIAMDANTGGFVINGVFNNDQSGIRVSGAGDVNGDGLADLIVATQSATDTYVVFGKADGTAVELSAVVAGTGGFAMTGPNGSWSVSGAGDVNGDGLADLILGAPYGFGTGVSYVVFSPESALASASYKSFSRIGDGAGGNPVVPNEVGDSRATIDYSDEDSADNGSGGASLETLTLMRSNSGIGNFPGNAADVVWRLQTDRQNWDSAGVALKSIDSERADLTLPEDRLAAFTATSLAGPWTKLVTTVDTAKNRWSFTDDGSTNSRCIAIGELNVTWAHFVFGSPETGQEASPYDTLQEAVDNVATGGTINIKGGTGDSDSPETLTITKAVTINAVGGAVTIGNPGARNAQPGPVGDSTSGFVHRGPN